MVVMVGVSVGSGVVLVSSGSGKESVVGMMVGVGDGIGPVLLPERKCWLREIVEKLEI